jgi:hypothetical protein
MRRVVSFTSQELMRVVRVAQAICDNKDDYRQRNGHGNKKKMSKRSDFDLIYTGKLGELAVGDVLGIPIDESVHDGSDGYVDMDFMGKTLQVKSSCLDDVFKVTDARELVFDYAILCVPVSPATMAICGYVSKQFFLANCYTKDYGYGPRKCLDARSFTPIEQLADAIKNSNEVAPAAVVRPRFLQPIERIRAG